MVLLLLYKGWSCLLLSPWPLGCWVVLVLILDGENRARRFLGRLRFLPLFPGSGILVLGSALCSPPTSLRLRMLPCTHVMLFAVCSHALLLLYSHWLPLQTKCPYVELGGREVRMSMCVSSTLAVVWSSAKESCLLVSSKWAVWLVSPLRERALSADARSYWLSRALPSLRSAAMPGSRRFTFLAALSCYCQAPSWGFPEA